MLGDPSYATCTLKHTCFAHKRQVAYRLAPPLLLVWLQGCAYVGWSRRPWLSTLSSGNRYASLR